MTPRETAMQIKEVTGSVARILFSCLRGNYVERLVQNNSIKTLLRQVIRANGGSRMFKKLEDYRRLKITAVLSILVIFASRVTVAVPVYPKSDHLSRSEHPDQSPRPIFEKAANLPIT